MMIALQKNDQPLAREQNRGWALLFSITSVKFGVALIGVLAVVLICATFLEAFFGMDFAAAYIYKSTWFIVLLFLLSANVLAAVLVRIPRNLGGAVSLLLAIGILILAAYYGDELSAWFGRNYRSPLLIAFSLSAAAVILVATLWNKQLGFFTAHCGILVLLLGAYQTYLNGFEGRLSLVEGEKANSMRLLNKDKFTVSRMAEHGQESPTQTSFIFSPGLVDWPEGRTFDSWKELDGIKLKVLRYYAHARINEDWIADETKDGDPAIRFAISSEGGMTMPASWLTGEPAGGPGFPQLKILQATVDSMREDFLNPPGGEKDGGGVDAKGVLSLHYDGRMQRIPVSENLGKKIALQDSKIEVEITNYYPNAKLRGTAQFESQGEEPKNPLLELLIYVPGQEKPIREIAYAKIPTLSLAVHGGECPVKVWYHQPACPAPAGLDFLRTPDGKLYGRVGLDGKYVSRGEVKEGSSLDFAEKLHFKVIKYLPFALHKVVPLPIEPAADEKNPPGAAALVEVEFGGVKQPVWLVRDEPKYNFQPIFTPEGNLVINFGYEDLPLGFTLKLTKFNRVMNPGMNPGRMGVAAFISTVRLVDDARGFDEVREIAMNQPLTYDKLTFYQADCAELDDGQKVSILSATYDPGRFLKYSGCLLVCLGMLLRYMTNFQYYKQLRQFLFQAEK
jgi:hypothetical protein